MSIYICITTLVNNLAVIKQRITVDGNSRALNSDLSSAYVSSSCPVCICTEVAQWENSRQKLVSLLKARTCTHWHTPHTTKVIPSSELGGSGCFLRGFIHLISKAGTRRHLKPSVMKAEEEVAFCFQWQDEHFDHTGLPAAGHICLLSLQPGLLYVHSPEKSEKLESSSRNCERQWNI